MYRSIPMALLIVFSLQASLHAVPPSAAMLPGGTKFHVSIPDVIKLEKAWKRTKLSQMFEDPKLKPFLNDLTKESSLAKLGLTWEDVLSVARGEMSFSMVLAAPGQAGHVMTLYAKDEKIALVKLLAKVAVSMEKQGYKVAITRVAGFPVTTYIRAAQDPRDRERHMFTFTKDEILVAADNEKVVEAVLERWDGKSADRLDQQKGYQEVQARAKAKTKMPSECFWFVEPLGLAEADRVAARPKPRRGPDMLKILRAEGFTAFQGVGGFVSVGLEGVDIIHHTAVYAPGPYEKSMRMLRTLVGDNFVPPEWVPTDAARIATVYLDVANAFNNFPSLFDAVYGEGDVGTFNDIIKGLRDDPNGPQVDVSKQIVGRLGNRVTLVFDTAKPIGPNSARSLVGVAANDEKGVAQAIRRLNENDEDIKPHELPGGVVMWEMITREKKKKKGAAAAAPKPKAPNSAVAVAQGQLFFASDVKLLEKVLTTKSTGMAAQGDFQRIDTALGKLGAGKDCLRSFARPDEEMQGVFEMMRTNQLDKTLSPYARVLVGVLGDSVTQIDGSTFPDFELFRQYIGPIGTYGINDTDGWFLVGCTLPRK